MARKATQQPDASCKSSLISRMTRLKIESTKHLKLIEKQVDELIEFASNETQEYEINAKTNHKQILSFMVDQLGLILLSTIVVAITVTHSIKKEITKHRRADEALQQHIHDLDERVKELTCLYSISKIFNRPNISLEENLEAVIGIFPPAWQYPEITCARIIFDSREFTTENFKETIWKQASDILVHEERVGTVEVFYLEEKPELEEGPFLKEERDLINDITIRLGETVEREQGKQALIESEKRYRNLIENIGLGISLIDTDYNIVMLNQAYTQMFNKPIHEMAGRKFFEEFKKKNTIYAYCPGTVAMETGEPCDVETEGVRDDGSCFPVHIHAFPVIDKEGVSSGFVEIIEDITERKQMESETKQLRDELAHVERVSTVGEMTATLAYELNQHLSAISSYAYGCINWLHSGEGEPDALLAAMEKISKQAGRASDLITHVQSFVCREEPRRETLDVNHVVRKITHLLKAEAHANQTAIMLDLKDDLPLIKGDLIQLQQVILNLARNGIEAMRKTDLSSRRLTITTTGHEGDMVAVAISDMGPGVSTEDENRLFTPFFTTKTHGLGLGLPICSTIVEAHGGSIGFVPNVKMGTVARFTLPVNEEGSPDDN